MKLRRLRIDRMPGIQDHFELDGLSDDVNVLVGPNASGKSSVVRAVRALLDPDAARKQGMIVEATFADPEGELEARRVGDDVHWRRAGTPVKAPPLPPAHLLACYTLHVADLTALGPTDEAIAHALARELSGGYDLDEVRRTAGFTTKSRHGQAEQKALQDATNEVRNGARAHERLAAEQARLEELGERLRATQAEAHRGPAYDAALELLDAERRVRELDALLDEYPPGMDLLRPDHLHQLDAAHEARTEANRARELAERELEQAHKDLRDTGLAEHDLGEPGLDAWRPVVSRMRDAESERERHARDESEQHAHLRLAREELGALDPAREATLDPATLRDLEDALDEKRRLDAELASDRATLDALPKPAATTASSATLEEGRRHLARWLRVPQGSWPLRRRAGLGLLLASLGIAIMAATTVHPAYALTAVAAGLGLAALSPARRHARRRTGARDAYEGTGLPDPPAWTTEGVNQRLDHLEQDIAEARRLELDLDRRATLERRLEEVRTRHDDLVARLSDRATEVGFDPLRLDGSFQRWLRLVEERDRARRALAAARSQRQRLDGALAEDHKNVTAFLTPYQAAPQVPNPDAAVLERALEALADRIRARDQARRDATRASEGIDEAERRLERSRAALRQLFEHARLLGDSDAEQALADEDARALDHELRARMDLLPGYRELVEERARTRAQAEVAEGRLDTEPDLKGAARRQDRETLEAHRHESAQAQTRADALRDEIATIHANIEHAGHARRLEAANAERQAAEDRLRDRLDEALAATAGAFLLEGVEAAHQVEHRPPTLERAARMFDRFTRHRYQLEFMPSEDGPAFRALERDTGQWRTPTELSTGTLAQLLLAVRVAFAVEAEHGYEPLPLFLDEALTTADAERFRAVADALRMLAREQGRQVFYLTARTDDAAFWRAEQADEASGDAPDEGTSPRVHIIDIAELRAQRRAIVDPGDLSLPPRPRPPHPGDDPPEAYAARLGVPPSDPWRDAGTTHVFHVLRDDLELVWRLLDRGVQYVGQLRALVQGPAAPHVLDEEEARRLDARMRATEAWIHAWREGRGRPVDRAALEASGAVTDTFLDRVDELAQALHGDGATLIEDLREGRIAGFRSDKRDELATYLTEHGYLDAREPLEAHDLELRVFTVLAERLGAGEDTWRQARTLAASLDTARADAFE